LTITALILNFQASKEKGIMHALASLSKRANQKEESALAKALFLMLSITSEKRCTHWFTTKLTGISRI
jgi:hypothetical protein